MTVEELERHCSPNLIKFYRERFRDPVKYNEVLLNYFRETVEPLDGVMNLLRKNLEPEHCYAELLSLFRRLAPTSLWDRLPQPDVSRDIVVATEWLRERMTDRVSGLCLGLDTLNMANGYNVRVGFSEECDPMQDGCEWLYSLLGETEYHIEGLAELHQEYSSGQWRERDARVPGRSPFAFADYKLFLGYAGIVLGNAVKQLEVEHPLLAIWGFYDGDLFLLGRRMPSAFEWLCRLPEG